MPTIPQPAPSSRILRFFFASSFSRFGNPGIEVDGVSGDIVARYDETSKPASLHDVSE